MKQRGDMLRHTFLVKDSVKPGWVGARRESGASIALLQTGLTLFPGRSVDQSLGNGSRKERKGKCFFPHCTTSGSTSLTDHGVNDRP